jgi:predicted CoA-binding protein
LETDDLTVWQRIVVAIKRDPYGRTARQVEEVLETARPYGVSKALSEVLTRTREHMEANERAEVACHVQSLLERSGLGQAEFASRIGVPSDDSDAPALRPVRQDAQPTPLEEDVADIAQILRTTRTVAIVGASDNPLRPSYGVWQYLKSASHYELYLVNPTISEVDGTPVYPSLDEVPVVPDLVDVFRRHEYLPSVLDDTIKVGAKTLWLQQGLRHEQVGRDGEAAGLQVVMDRCLKVDYARLIG